jgi:hypothetical protein
MEDSKHYNNYPKSLQGYQCIGPCYKKNTKIIHPLYLNIITNDKDDYFCPTNEWIHKDNKGNLQRFYTDKCNNDITKKRDINDLLYPHTNFDELSFIDTFYNINNFSDALDWISENKSSPISTKQRIFDLSLQAFKDSFDIFNFNDTRIVDFLINLIKEKYLDTFSINFLKYIHIIKDEVIIKYDKDYNYNNETKESIIIKQNFIIKHILTIENMTSFINIYFTKKQETNTMEYPSEIIINKFILYLISNIKKTFIK